MGWAATVFLVAAGPKITLAAELPHLADDESREVAFLVGAGTPDSLAAASLLAHLVETHDARQKPDSSALIGRAAELAPTRPEIIWLLLRDCEMRRCPEESSIAERLRSLDPDNGLTLLSDLKASQAGSPVETTRVIARLGKSRYLHLYWNKSLVMLFDAMTHGSKAPPATAVTREADDRLLHASGVLSAIDVPPFRPIIAACGTGAFAESGRREACESLMARLDDSDSMIAQSLSVSIQSKWWPSSSAEGQTLRSRRLQQEYLIQASGRDRGKQANSDALLRVSEMRKLATEAEVDMAILAAFRDPPLRPDKWHIEGG